MPIIAVYAAGDLYSRDDVASTTRSTGGPDGGHVPARCAGYVYDGAAYCPACASDVEVEVDGGDYDGETFQLNRFPAFNESGTSVTDSGGFGVGVVSGTDEWDYPGAVCDQCGDVLDTNILVYDSGNAHPNPVVELEEEHGDGYVSAAVVREHGGSDETVPDQVDVIVLEDSEEFEAGEMQKGVPMEYIEDYD